MRVGGDIDAAILPVPSVTLRDIAIGPAGEASRLRARSLRIELGLGPLMRGELRAVEMRLVAPQFSIGLDSQGQIDWPPLALATETLSIDRLRIEDGRATLTDAASGSRLVLDQLWFAGEVRSLTGPFRGKGEFVAGGQLYGYDVSAGRQGAGRHAGEARPEDRRAAADHRGRRHAGVRARRAALRRRRSRCRGRPARCWRAARRWPTSRGG